MLRPPRKWVSGAQQLEERVRFTKTIPSQFRQDFRSDHVHGIGVATRSCSSVHNRLQGYLKILPRSFQLHQRGSILYLLHFDSV